MNEISEISMEIIESIKAKQKMDIKKIMEISAAMVDCLEDGNKILICGNGGSAADSQHVAGELVGRFKLERRGLPCIALTTDTSIITAYANDYSFDDIFMRQVEALGSDGDILIGISTSGNSRNVIKAVEKAKEMNIMTVCLTGKNGKLKDMCDICLNIPSDNTPRIQECHITALHIICNLVEKRMFGNKS